VVVDVGAFVVVVEVVPVVVVAAFVVDVPPKVVCPKVVADFVVVVPRRVVCPGVVPGCILIMLVILPSFFPSET
jgi:hypothetical protein